MADETPTWFSTLDAEHQAHIAGKGWNALEPAAAAAEASKAHFAAQKLIGHPTDQVLKLPKDAADPTYADVYNRVVGMGLPKDPNEYKFDGIKFRDGTALPEADVAFIRELAVKHKLSIPAAQGIAADLAGRRDTMVDTNSNATALARGSNEVALRRQWGAEFDVKSYTAERALAAAGFPPAMLDYVKGLAEADHLKSMDALSKFGTAMNEATLLRGGGGVQVDPTAGMSADAAQVRLDMLKGDRDWGAKFLAGAAAETEEFNKLTKIVANSRVPQAR